MNRKRLLLLFFLLIGFASYAHEQPAKRMIREWTDTIYYHFYNGVQMIEFDFHKNYMRATFQGAGTSPMGGKESFNYHGRRYRNNTIIFRNIKGEILKSFNDSGLDPEFSGLTPVNELKKLSYHTRTRHIPSLRSGVRYKLNGKYSIGELMHIFDDEGVEQDVIRYGLIDSLGNSLIQPKLHSIYIFKSKYIVDYGKKQGVLNDDLTEFIPPTYDLIKPSGGTDGNFDIAQDSLWGMLDSFGNVLLEPEYNSFHYGDNFLFVTKDNFIGVLTPELSVVIPIELSSCERYYGGYIIEKNGMYGLMNLLCESIIDFTYGMIRTYSGHRDYFQVRDKGLWGVLDNKTGEVMISCTHKTPITHRHLYLIRD